MKKVLIFGISGFVGKYLLDEFLNNGYDVYGADLNKNENLFNISEYFECNILLKERVKEVIEKVSPTHIVNLAAISSVGQSWKIPAITMQINVNGTINIFESCLELNIKPRILLIGSSEEYLPHNCAINEKGGLDANNPYGISKIAQEQFAKLYREKYCWDIFCVRAFNHIGVGQNTSFVIPSWCKQIVAIEKGFQDPVLKVGNIKVARDFTDVRDVVRAYRLVIESNDCNQIYNIGSGKAYSLDQILSFILSSANKKIDIETDPMLLRKNDNPFICCDYKLIKDRVGWEPLIDIYDSILRIIDFYRKTL